MAKHFIKMYFNLQAISMFWNLSLSLSYEKYQYILFLLSAKEGGKVEEKVKTKMAPSGSGGRVFAMKSLTIFSHIKYENVNLILKSFFKNNSTVNLRHFLTRDTQEKAKGKKRQKRRRRIKYYR